MSNIKLRVWDGKKKTIVVPMIAMKYDPLLSKPMVVDRFTGLKDKNGKEIYEGDFVWDGYFTYEIKQGLHTITVPCEHANAEHEIIGFYLKPLEEGRDEYNLIQIESGDFEVVGNIYENPELLKRD